MECCIGHLSCFLKTDTSYIISSERNEYDFKIERLILRKMEQSDFDALCKILKDEETMYAYEGALIEAVAACKDYAFEVLNANEVCSIIRDTNTASQKVALRNGMAVTGESWTKHYRGVDMPTYIKKHTLFVGKNGGFIWVNLCTDL